MKKAYLENKDIYLRFAEYEDIEDLFEWRNDQDTKKASFNSNEIDIKEHKKWFKESFINPKRNIFIICDKQCNKLGQIRFDKKGDSAEVDITINPKYRSQGIGTLTLNKYSKYYLNNFTVKRLIARVKTNNIPSLNTFEKAGFKIHKKIDKYIELRYEK